MNKKMVMVLVAVVVAVVVGVTLWLTSVKKEEAVPAPPVTTKGEAMKEELVIELDKGNVELELFPQDAPKTVARIKELAEQGFYNGLTFHRVVPGFVVQGGDPSGNGTGGSGKKLPAEFNDRQHVEGTLAMARSMDPNSADSQFYISLGRHPHLDKSYTVFGQVTSGMEFVRQIKQGDKMLKVYVKKPQ